MNTYNLNRASDLGRYITNRNRNLISESISGPEFYLSAPIESLTDEYNADGKLIFMKSSSLYDSVCLCDEKLSFDDIDGICYDTRITVYCIEGHIEDMSRCIYDDELSFDILSGNRGQGVTYKIEILGEETYGFGI